MRVTDADVAPELDGAPFLVMELLDGMDFEKAAQLSPPSPATAVSWLRQVARAMDKAHRLGIVHRDLKPENLFLAQVEDRAPVVKVLDFGIAKMAQEGLVLTEAQLARRRSAAVTLCRSSDQERWAGSHQPRVNPYRVNLTRGGSVDKPVTL